MFRVARYFPDQAVRDDVVVSRGRREEEALTGSEQNWKGRIDDNGL